MDIQIYSQDCLCLISDFEIPEQFEAIWKYLKAAYKTKEYYRSSPSDQEIVAFWAENPTVPKLSATNKQLYGIKTQPRYSLHKLLTEDELKIMNA